jgi:RNA polymerase sigma-70 factor (ECF subfamily)
MDGADRQLRHLVAAAIEGDDVAVREFVRMTQPAVWRICTALGSSGHEEDLTQETFVRAFRSLPTFRGDSPVVPWLLTIARRVCADHVRGRQRQRRLLGALIDSSSADAFSRSAVDHDHAIWSVLDGIQPDRREAFMLTQVAGLSYDEAADILGCPIGTVRSRVARARADLIIAVRAAEAS